MKYIRMKKTYRNQPLSPTEFCLDATFGEMEDVQGCMSGHGYGAFVMVHRDYKGQIEVVVLDPDYCKAPDDKAAAWKSDAVGWYVELQRAMDNIRSLQIGSVT